MRNSDDLETFIGSRQIIGLSEIVEIPAMTGQNGLVFKYLSGGSLEIGASNLTWGMGYLMDEGEPVTGNLVGSFYAAATGATVIATILRGKEAGF